MNKIIDKYNVMINGILFQKGIDNNGNGTLYISEDTKLFLVHRGWTLSNIKYIDLKRTEIPKLLDMHNNTCDYGRDILKAQSIHIHDSAGYVYPQKMCASSLLHICAKNFIANKKIICNNWFIISFILHYYSIRSFFCKYYLPDGNLQWVRGVILFANYVRKFLLYYKWPTCMIEHDNMKKLMNRLFNLVDMNINELKAEKLLFYNVYYINLLYSLLIDMMNGKLL